MDYQDFLLPALERVLAWDLPDEAFGAATAQEAGLMAGADPEQSGYGWND